VEGLPRVEVGEAHHGSEFDANLGQARNDLQNLGQARNDLQRPFTHSPDVVRSFPAEDNHPFRKRPRMHDMKNRDKTSGVKQRRTWSPTTWPKAGNVVIL